MHSPGIEPGSYAWEAYILPLNHGCLFIHNFQISFLIFLTANNVIFSYFFSKVDRRKFLLFSQLYLSATKLFPTYIKQ